MIVKNEESVLENALNSCMSFADEIIIVDTGSTDKTKEIAKSFTDKIYDFKWCDDFSKARNFSFEKASKDYILWLDADDIILKKDQEKIIKLKQDNTFPNAYYFKYVIDFDENFKSKFHFYRERLLKRSCNFLWQDPVHEVIEIYGTYEHMDICIYHNKKEKVAKSPSTDKSRNLKIYEKIIERGTPLTPRQKFYYARELYYNNKISDAINNFEEYLKIPNTFIENKIECYLNLSNCYVILNQLEKAKETLFKSFTYSLPRANILLELSNIYIKENNFKSALYYLKQIKKDKNDKSGAFIQPDYYDFYPNLNKCLCYYRLGDFKKSLKYHNKTKKLRPNDPRVLHNDNFFKTINIIQ